MVIKIRIVIERWATTRRADNVLQGLPDGYVLATYLVIVSSKSTIVSSFVLGLIWNKINNQVIRQ